MPGVATQVDISRGWMKFKLVYRTPFAAPALPCVCCPDSAEETRNCSDSGRSKLARKKVEEQQRRKDQQIWAARFALRARFGMAQLWLFTASLTSLSEASGSPSEVSCLRSSQSWGSRKPRRSTTQLGYPWKESCSGCGICLRNFVMYMQYVLF